MVFVLNQVFALLAAYGAVGAGSDPASISFVKVAPPPPTPIAAPVIDKNLARLEPAKGCILGAYIDLDPNLSQSYQDQNGRSRKLPEEFEDKLGVPHGMYFFYLGYGQPLPMDWVKRLASQDKYVHIAFEPNDGLEAVQDDDYLRKFAEDCRDSGAKIFVRFASEMNGNWTKYSGQPKLYVEKFRLVSRVLRQAPNVAMVWCPYTTPENPIPAYYPGDDFVDWVGVNMYSVTYFNQNLNTPGAHVEPKDMVEFVYNRWTRTKPMMICEYAATNYSAAEDSDVTDFAVRKIRALYEDLPKRFPRVKAINYFSTNAIQLEHRKNNDYTLTRVESIGRLYRDLVSSSYFLKEAPKPPTPPKPVVPFSPALEDGKTIQVGDKVEVVIPEGVEASAVIISVNGKVANARFEEGKWRWLAAQTGSVRIHAEVLDKNGRTVGTAQMNLIVVSG